MADNKKYIYSIKKVIMTKLGKYLSEKYINKAEISRQTGISQNRLSYLTNNEKAELKAKELVLLSKALKIDPNELLNVIFEDI